VRCIYEGHAARLTTAHYPALRIPATKLGVEASYATFAFTGSAGWGSSFQSDSASEAATIVASTNVRIASASLNDVVNLALCSTFKARVKDALKNPGNVNAIRFIIDQYGMFLSSLA
jgi:hypothetical protein